MDNIIYKVLIAKNMTQAELAKKVGVKTEYMNRIINGKIIPTLPLGMRIARALDKRVEDIFLE
jgi:putative transcriptional regulator